jgi:hypothetical protein
MTQLGYWGRRGNLLAAVVLLFLAPGSRAAAADVEARDFTILVDGKRAGEYHMTITRQDDGSFTMTGQADVRVTVMIVKTYTYSYRGTEVWKDGRLVRFDSQTNDDGKRFVVSAVADGNNLRIKANGQERLARPDIWLSTYWRLADPRFRNQGVPLVDADTGKDISATLQHVGSNSINVNGQMQTCVHYRVSGGVQVDVWYDAQERLVRQESIEEGHRTVLELSRIRR